LSLLHNSRSFRSSHVPPLSTPLPSAAFFSFFDTSSLKMRSCSSLPFLALLAFFSSAFAQTYVQFSNVGYYDATVSCRDVSTSLEGKKEKVEETR
jgi:hypothetical protein